MNGGLKMARLFTYIFITVGLMILLSLVGFDTSASYVLNQIGILNNPGGFESSNFHLGIILGLIALAGTAAIIFGFISGGNIETIATAGLVVLGATPLAFFLTDFISIVQLAKNAGGWEYYLIALICSPIIIGYSMSLWDWVRGND